MAASLSDFTGLDASGNVTLAAQWPLLVRAVQSLASYFGAKFITGTEPNDKLVGIQFSGSAVEWRIYTDGVNLKVQENTGTSQNPVWTDRGQWTSGTGLLLDASAILTGTFADARIAQSNVTQHQASIDHGSIAGLGDDDHPQYVRADGTRNITGAIKVKNTADADLALTIDAGSTVDKIAQLILAARGASKYSLRFDPTDGALYIRDEAAATNIAKFTASGGITDLINPSGGGDAVRTVLSGGNWLPSSTAEQIVQDNASPANLLQATLTNANGVADYMARGSVRIGHNSSVWARYVLRVRAGTAGSTADPLIYETAAHIYGTYGPVNIDIPPVLLSAPAANTVVSVTVQKATGAGTEGMTVFAADTTSGPFLDVRRIS